MILTVPLQYGTQLANVRYKWLVGGVEQAEQSSGIGQPDPLYPLFTFTVTPPQNADEMIAYDITNALNWNVGGYKTAVAATFPPGPPPTLVTLPAFGPPGLRTVSAKSVIDGILRQHGFDPVGDAISHDTNRAIIDQANAAVQYAWRYWEWPQLELLQERAFRTQWTNTLQFYRIGTEGVPDELYYPGDTNYYRVLASAPADPPVGTPPTNTTYFEKIDLTDRYILLDQVNETPIGEVIEIFAADPRLDTEHDANRVRFRPTEREISCLDNATPTVFVEFRIPPSQFTGVPYVAGRNYAVGAAVLNPSDGECYRALVANPSGDPTAQPTQWLKIPFPQIFSQYVILAAFAAGLGESDPLEKDWNSRAQRAAAANQAAEEALSQEVDRLRAQGQHYHYRRWRTPYSPFWWRYPCVSPNAA